MKKKTWIQKFIHDIGVSFFYGICFSILLFVIGGIAGFFLFDWQNSFQKILQGSISALFLAGSLGLVTSSFLFLKIKRKEDSAINETWSKKFTLFSYQTGILVISIIILFIGSLLDLLRFFL